MSIAIAIENLSSRIQDAYIALSAKGATIPTTKDSYNLSATVDTITELKAQNKGVIYADRTTDLTSGPPTNRQYTKTIAPDSGYNGISSIQFKYGTIKNKVITPTTSAQIFESPIRNGIVGYENITISAVDSTIDSSIQAGNIKNGVTILGVTGTYEAASTSSRHVYIHAKDANDTTMQIGTSSSTDISYQELFLDLSSSEYDNKNIVFSSTSDYQTAYIMYEDGTTSTQSLPVTILISQSFSICLVCYDYCLDKDTRILLSDNTEKRISDLTIKDKIMTLNPDTLELEEDELTYCDSHILKYHDEKDIWFFDDRTEITTVRPHEFYNIDEHQFMYIADFKIGDRIYKVDGTAPRLVSHKNVKEKTEHYTIFTKKYNNYFANGILTGNRKSSKISIIEN